MKKMNQSVAALFAFALILSIGFPLGVVGIVFGATKGIAALLVFGIIFAVAGFYGMPLVWIVYANRRGQRRVLRVILNEKIYDIDELAEQFKKTPDEISKTLTYLIVRNFLTGFMLKGNKLVSTIKNVHETGKPYRCPSCGANMKFVENKYICEYCGNNK